MQGSSKKDTSVFDFDSEHAAVELSSRKYLEKLLGSGNHGHRNSPVTQYTSRKARMEDQMVNKNGMPRLQSVERKKRKMKWTHMQDDMFIHLLVKQCREGGAIKGGYTTEGWHKLTEKMTKVYGTELSEVKLKNRFKTYEKMYGIMKKMLSLREFRWCRTRKMVMSEGRAWDYYIEAHREAGPYRYKVLPDYYMLAEIFGNSIADGRERIANNGPNLTQNDESSLARNLDDENELDEDISNANKRIRANSTTPSTSHHLAKNHSNMGIAWVGAIEIIANAITEYAKKQAGGNPPTSKCIVDALKVLGLDESSFFTALHVLENGRKVDTLLTLGSVACNSWVMIELNLQ